MRFFLDESGSTGDAIRTGNTFDFAGQPIFVLSAIGTGDSAALEAELARLAGRHGVRGSEIKSGDIAHLPGFASDLAAYLASADCPIFIEVMDKRFLLVANLLNQVVMPPVPGFDDRPDSLFVRTLLAEVIFDHLPSTVLRQFAAACAAPSRVALGELFDALSRWAKQHPGLDDFRPTLLALIADGAGEFEVDTQADAHLRWLPIPDNSVTGRPIWILPGLSALTNIYARINKFRRGALAEVELIHDEHMLYGNILSGAKAQMEALSAGGGLPYVPNADYRLREKASLSFQKSESSRGIQAADVLGGFVMRFVRDLLYGRLPTQARLQAMDAIMALSRPDQARGLNFVMSKRDLAKMNISWS